MNCVGQKRLIHCEIHIMLTVMAPISSVEVYYDTKVLASSYRDGKSTYVHRLNDDAVGYAVAY